VRAGGRVEESSATPAVAGKRIKIGKGRKLKNLAMFTRQLAVLVASGTPLADAMGALERQSKDKAWRELVAALRLRIEEGMPLSEMAFKEALRLKPPVPSMPRRAIKDFTFKGYAIPAGTMVGVNPLFTHHMPDIWPEPEKFDPLRFSDEAQRNRHRFAWVPYGGGAHMCLGLHFAYMQAKCFARHFLQNLEVSLEPGYRPDWQMWPIPKPRDGLRVMLKAV